MAARLQAMGINRYEQIADWRAEDVRAVSAALGIGRAISRGNWIEQAALLAQRSRKAAETSPAPVGPPPASPLLAPPTSAYLAAHANELPAPPQRCHHRQ